MFYTFNLKAVRWWVVGLLAGLMGWAVWSVVDRNSWGSVVPVAFERNFAPAPALPAAGSSTVPEARSPVVLGDESLVPTAAEPPRAETLQAGRRMDPDEFRLSRERLRSQEMELARQILDDPQASEARKTEAQRQLLELLQRSRRELEIEQLLAAAGITNAAVSIGESGVQVVVPQPVTAQGAARIGELVARMAGVRREDISIIDSLTAFGPEGAWQESGRPR